MATSDLSAECFQSADGELLGLGVRIGTYLQVFSAIINLKLDADDAPGGAWLQAGPPAARVAPRPFPHMADPSPSPPLLQCFTAVSILAFALKFVLQGTISNGMFLATAYIGWMQLLILPAVLLLPAVRCLKLLVLLISVSVLFAFSLLLWYFIKGYQRLEDVAACGATQAFFFARVDNAFGWFRWLNVGILGAAAAGYLALLTMVGPSTSFSRALRASCRRALKWPLSVMSVLLTLWAILIIGCELTISWNDVPDVYSLNR